MRPYNRSSPLIFIHVPKTAGTSVGRVFKKWFGEGLIHHFYDERRAQLPKRHDIKARHTLEVPVCVIGHFNRLRGFGVEDYYPDCRQFLTILRDPFEMMVSSYFFVRKFGDDWVDQSRVPGEGLEEYLANTPPNMLNHFPRVITRENYKEVFEKYFIEIGLTEYLEQSVQRFSDSLGMPFDSSDLPQLNVGQHSTVEYENLRESYQERFPLEFEVYNYAKQRFLTLHRS